MTEDEVVDPEHGRGLRARMAALVVVGVVFTAFVVQNTESQKVTWLVFDFSLPLWALVVSSAVVGVILRDLFGWIRSRRG